MNGPICNFTTIIDPSKTVGNKKNKPRFDPELAEMEALRSQQTKTSQTEAPRTYDLKVPDDSLTDNYFDISDDMTPEEFGMIITKEPPLPFSEYMDQDDPIHTLNTDATIDNGVSVDNEDVCFIKPTDVWGAGNDVLEPPEGYFPPPGKMPKPPFLNQIGYLGPLPQPSPQPKQEEPKQYTPTYTSCRPAEPCINPALIPYNQAQDINHHTLEDIVKMAISDHTTEMTEEAKRHYRHLEPNTPMEVPLQPPTVELTTPTTQELPELNITPPDDYYPQDTAPEFKVNTFKNYSTRQDDDIVCIMSDDLDICDGLLVSEHHRVYDTETNLEVKWSISNCTDHDIIMVDRRGMAARLQPVGNENTRKSLFIDIKPEVQEHKTQFNRDYVKGVTVDVNDNCKVKELGSASSGFNSSVTPLTTLDPAQRHAYELTEFDKRGEFNYEIPGAFIKSDRGIYVRQLDVTLYYGSEVSPTITHPYLYEQVMTEPLGKWIGVQPPPGSFFKYIKIVKNSGPALTAYIIINQRVAEIRSYKDPTLKDGVYMTSDLEENNVFYSNDYLRRIDLDHMYDREYTDPFILVRTRSEAESMIVDEDYHKNKELLKEKKELVEAQRKKEEELHRQKQEFEREKREHELAKMSFEEEKLERQRKEEKKAAKRKKKKEKEKRRFEKRLQKIKAKQVRIKHEYDTKISSLRLQESQYRSEITRRKSWTDYIKGAVSTTMSVISAVVSIAVLLFK